MSRGSPPTIHSRDGIEKWVNPLYNPIMDTTVTLDKAGRVVIPKPLREELHLGPGDRLQLETEGEKMTLRPVRTTAPLRKERGVWVYRTGFPLSAAATDHVLRETREERVRRGFGKAE